MKKTKVYGDRTCAACRGLCHENSWRRKVGIRRRYYCCLGHVVRSNIGDRLDLTENDTELINEFFEPVDVISL